MINNIENLDEQIITNVARWTIFQISSVCFEFGGIVSKKVIKKYIPINNYFWYRFFWDLKHNTNSNYNKDIFGFQYDVLISKYDEGT